MANVDADAPARPPSLGASAFYGSTGGFATFVSNNAGPILNTHLLRLGLEKEELVGTSAWFYFGVNVSKFPLYLALGWWSHGGGFFTAETLNLSPGIVFDNFIRFRRHQCEFHA